MKAWRSCLRSIASASRASAGALPGDHQHHRVAQLSSTARQWPGDQLSQCGDDDALGCCRLPRSREGVSQAARSCQHSCTHPCPAACSNSTEKGRIIISTTGLTFNYGRDIARKATDQKEKSTLAEHTYKYSSNDRGSAPCSPGNFSVTDPSACINTTMTEASPRKKWID